MTDGVQRRSLQHLNTGTIWLKLTPMRATLVVALKPVIARSAMVVARSYQINCSSATCKA
jgi:hypothetical protein